MSETQKLDQTRRMPPQEPDRDEASRYTGGSLAAGEQIGEAKVLEKIHARSGEAEIYKGLLGSEVVVIKYYYPNFQAKTDILKQLQGIRHPDIVNVLGFGRHKDRFYEVMQYAAGGSLADRKPDESWRYLPLNEARTMDVVKETVNAFKFCHEKGIVHRDIKPDNMYFREEGADVLIGDFGISSVLDMEGGMSKRMTTTSRTEGYAAPEVYSSVIGPEVDYYALGITVYILLTGEDPFAQRNPAHVMRDTVQGRVVDDLLTRPLGQKISRRMQTLIRGLLVVRHDKRWGFKEVEQWLDGKDVPVFKETVQKEIPALEFGDRQVRSVEELAAACAANRELGKKMLYRQMIERWIEKFDTGLAVEIGDIREEQSNPATHEAGLSIAIYRLDPARSFKTGSLEFASPADLAAAFKKDAVPLLPLLRRADSELHIWMKARGMQEFSKTAAKLSGEVQSDKRFLNTLRLALEGPLFRPFEDDELELASIEDLWRLPESMRARVLSAASEADSRFDVWLAKTGDKSAVAAWSSYQIGKTWDNFQEVFTGGCVLDGSVWKTRSQIQSDQQAAERKKKIEMLKRKREQEELEKEKASLLEVPRKVGWAYAAILLGAFLCLILFMVFMVAAEAYIRAENSLVFAAVTAIAPMVICGFGGLFALGKVRGGPGLAGKGLPHIRILVAQEQLGEARQRRSAAYKILKLLFILLTACSVIEGTLAFQALSRQSQATHVRHQAMAALAAEGWPLFSDGSGIYSGNAEKFEEAANDCLREGSRLPTNSEYKLACAKLKQYLDPYGTGLRKEACAGYWSLSGELIRMDENCEPRISADYESGVYCHYCRR